MNGVSKLIALRNATAVIPVICAFAGCSPRAEDPATAAKSMKEINSGYVSSESDWLNFLTCWNEGLRRTGKRDSPTQESTNQLAAIGDKEHDARSVALVHLEKQLNSGALPRSFRHFSLVTGGQWLAMPRSESPHPSNFLPISSVGLFKTVDTVNWSVWHQAMGGTAERPLSDADYYQYNDKQDFFRWSYLDKLIKVGELEQGAVLLINPLEVTADGEWEAWLLSPQLAGAYRYRSFAELMQTIAYQEVNETGGRNIGRDKLLASCGAHLKTAATSP